MESQTISEDSRGTICQKADPNHRSNAIDIMNVAIRHNNQGVALLEMGRHQGALAEFKIAALQLHSLTCELHQRQMFDESTFLSQSLSRHSWIPTDNAFVRSTAILLTPTDKPPTSCTTESATILINMALSYHLNSMIPNSLQDATRNAIELYRMANSLAARCTPDSLSHQIILISLNNLGQLQHELGNFDASKAYFEDLSTYVVWLRGSSEASMVSDRHDFMINAMVLGSSNICAGAA